MTSTRRRTFLALAIAASTVAGGLRGQDTQETGRENRAQEPGRRPPGVPREQIAAGGWPILEWRHASGDWGGLRSWLEERGVVPELFLTTDGSVVASGGADSGGTALRSLFDATVTLDGEKLLGWRGSRFFADFQVQRGTNGSTDAGDLQAFSNIDGDDRSQLAKVWYEQVLWDRLLRVKVGKADANTDFAYVEHGFRLLNSSFGYSPTILGFPTYPDPSFGAAAFVRPGGGVYCGGGLYDGAAQSGFKTGQRGPDTLFGAPSDLFAIAEAGLRWRGADGARPGRLGIGGWRHTGDFARFQGGVENGTDGVYAVLDQLLWTPEDRGDSARGLGGFVQVGIADQDVSPVDWHLGCGLSWTGPFASRPDDAVGLGLSYASFSDAPGAGLKGDGELAVEAFYTWSATPWVRIKPDVQWIRDPGGAGLDDALVLTLRVAITF